MGVLLFSLIAHLNVVWKKDYGDPSRKLVMLCLADMANKAGVCWPSVATLCKRCSLSRRPVQRHLAALEAAGHLTIKPRFKDGKSTSNNYQIVTVGGVAHDAVGVSCTPHRITIESNGGLKDPRSMLTRPTQLPRSLRRRQD